MANDAKLPLVVTCDWCQERLLTTRGQALTAAIDHALDEHRERFLTLAATDPDEACRAFTVSQPTGSGTAQRRLRPDRTYPYGWTWT